MHSLLLVTRHTAATCASLCRPPACTAASLDPATGDCVAGRLTCAAPPASGPSRAVFAAGERAPGAYLGCFRDAADRVLPGASFGGLADLTPAACMDRCLERGFSYSGVEVGNQCFCGREAPDQGLKVLN